MKNRKRSKKIYEKVKDILPKHININDVEIWFQDESRIGQQGALTRVWHYKGERPRLIRQQQFNSAYIFGAVCPETGKYSGLIMPYVNKEAMALHMQSISEQVSEGKHAVVVMDGALWHQASLNLPNATILQLPPYSPELNPMEQVWQVIKQRWLSNCCYASYEAIVERCCEAWNAMCQETQLLKSLTQRQWIY